MTDKPLDCIGLPLIARVGKHDFRPQCTATTNSVEQSAGFSVESLAKVVTMLKAAPPEEERIDHACVGKEYWRMLGKNCIKAEGKPVYGGGGMLGTLGGTRIILDEDLPPDVCEFRNKDGKVLSQLRLKQ